MANLFGLPSPDEVRQNTRRRMFGQAPQMFGTGAQGFGGILGMALGSAARDKWGKPSADVTRAQNVQSILNQTIADIGADPKSMDMAGMQQLGTAYAKNLLKGGELDLGLNVMKSISAMQNAQGTQAKPTGSTSGFFRLDAQGNPIMIKDPITGKSLMPAYADPETRSKYVRAGAQAKSRQELIDSGFESIQGVRENVSDLREAKRLVGEGATTGAIMDKLPSLFAPTVALKQMQAKLGLNVVGSVQFGALSEGELDLAKAVALPTGLGGAELTNWIDRKIAAQEKLSGYLEKQIDYMDQGGTKAGWLREIKRQKGKKKEPVIQEVDW